MSAPITVVACSREPAGMCSAACVQRSSWGGLSSVSRSVSRTRRARVGPTPSRSFNRRNQLSSSAALSARRRSAMKSFTCAASRYFNAPYFTNGIPRRVSSTSNSTGSWLVRYRTPCSRSSMPSSRAASTRSHISRACSASSRGNESSGRLPPSRSVHRVFGYPSRSCSGGLLPRLCDTHRIVRDEYELWAARQRLAQISSPRPRLLPARYRETSPAYCAPLVGAITSGWLASASDPPAATASSKRGRWTHKIISPRPSLRTMPRARRRHAPVLPEFHHRL